MKKNDPIQLQKIKSDISNLKEIVDAKWLLEKIENKKSN
jgi:hypothetical protein